MIGVRVKVRVVGIRVRVRVGVRVGMGGMVRVRHACRKSRTSGTKAQECSNCLAVEAHLKRRHKKGDRSSPDRRTKTKKKRCLSVYFVLSTWIVMMP